MGANKILAKRGGLTRWINIILYWVFERKDNHKVECTCINMMIRPKLVRILKLKQIFIIWGKSESTKVA